VRETVVLPTPPLSAPTTSTAGLAMSVPSTAPLTEKGGQQVPYLLCGGQHGRKKG
jgi:hypothetical protein